MTDRTSPIAAAEVAPRARLSNYPPAFAAKVEGRVKRALGDAFGLTGFGVNLTTLAPGSQSALLHRHTVQEEFVFVLAGHPTLRTDRGEHALAPGMCIGFRPGGPAHHLVNRTDEPVEYFEIGDRRENDGGEYPEDDLVAQRIGGKWRFHRRDGTSW